MEMESRDETLNQLLRQIFGFDQFRPNQREIIEAILAHRDVLAVMPTGGGKSLCYQLPAVILPGLCVVVSPLLSLMKDQVDAAREIGLAAATLNSMTDNIEYVEIMRLIEAESLDLLYVSPERIAAAGFLDRLAECKLSFFAIDEAHCVSEWGHQFRPDYLALGTIAEHFPAVPIAAFTATATDQVSDDIINHLHLRTPFRVRASFDRPNLHYRVVYKTNLTRQLVDFLNTVPNQSGIIYRQTRKKVEETAAVLAKKGFNVRPYHAGMSDEERLRAQELFAEDTVPIIVATIAFGMGIDKSNVRFVVHADLPKNIESYYQETGRAGRDFSPAQCLLLFGYHDVALNRAFIEQTEDEEVRENLTRQLFEMVRYAEADQCRRKMLLCYFGEEYTKDNCGNCDFCNQEIKREDATINAQKALSAMQRTGNRFGIEYLSDILTGKLTDRNQKFRHNLLPTFGVGADQDKKYWRLLIQALIGRNAARLSDGEYPVPQVTEYGWRIMRGQENFGMISFPVVVGGRKKKEKSERIRTGRNTPLREELTDQESGLFEHLRRLRMEIARKRHVPPYVIFTDLSLTEMARLRPKTEEEMLAISGVGRRKMASYGEQFLAAVNGTPWPKPTAEEYSGRPIPQKNPFGDPLNRGSDDFAGDSVDFTGDSDDYTGDSDDFTGGSDDSDDFTGDCPGDGPVFFPDPQ